MTSLGSHVEFDCSNGGTITMLTSSRGHSMFGLIDGWATYDNLRVNADTDMNLNIGEGYDVTTIVQHLTGDAVMDFALTSRQPNGVADIRVTGLKPHEWYRLRFDNILAQTADGVAHGQTTGDGVLQFNGVKVPDGRR